MGGAKKAWMDQEQSDKGYDGPTSEVHGKCNNCNEGIVTHFKDDTPGGKDSEYSCSNKKCNGKNTK